MPGDGGPAVDEFWQTSVAGRNGSVVCRLVDGSGIVSRKKPNFATGLGHKRR